MSYALFRDVHWIIPPAKKNIQTYNSLVRLACLGPNQAPTTTNVPPSLSLSPRSELSPDKKKWEEIGDIVESKRNKLKKSEHSPLLLDIETFEFPK